MNQTSERLAILHVIDGLLTGLPNDQLHDLANELRAQRDGGKCIDGCAQKAARGDASKPPMAFIPASFMFETARALAHGAAKYSPDNWRRGMAWSDVYSSLQRHLWAWWGGEDRDTESGLSHLAHASACLAFLVEYDTNGNYRRFDDRWRSDQPPAMGEGGD